MTTKLSVVCHILWWIVVQIRASIASRGLVVVGWYHSHPYSEPRPSQNDVLSHKKYQDALTNKSGEEPCVGLIISPNLGAKEEGAESKIGVFWVLTVTAGWTPDLAYGGKDYHQLGAVPHTGDCGRHGLPGLILQDQT
ncbi:MPN domain-containing protein [Geodia barretti]|uniref:MPN domain-containing protein n=1 Tax=Geodia barretti TaxID=519541 RepID=A0AA35T903_GEOBA|nr:MPN domain-containing protein [Geodia barretti]